MNEDLGSGIGVHNVTEEEFCVTDNEAAEVLYSVLHSPSISRAASYSAYREPIAYISTGKSKPFQSLSSPATDTWNGVESASGLSDIKQLLVIDTDRLSSAEHTNSFHSPGRSNFNSSSSELNLDMARSPMQSLLDLASMCERR